MQQNYCVSDLEYYEYPKFVPHVLLCGDNVIAILQSCWTLYNGLILPIHTLMLYVRK